MFVFPFTLTTSLKMPLGRFPFEQKIRKFRLGSEWNRHFPEFHSEILGVPREVGLKFRKIGITGKFRSIRPFLLAPSFSEPGNRNSTWLILKLLNIILVLYETNDWNILLQRYCSGLASQALVEKVIWVIGVLRRTVVIDWRFDNLCGSHLQSQVVDKSVENSKTLVSDLIGQ